MKKPQELNYEVGPIAEVFFGRQKRMVTITVFHHTSIANILHAEVVTLKFGWPPVIKTKGYVGQAEIDAAVADNTHKGGGK